MNSISLIVTGLFKLCLSYLVIVVVLYFSRIDLFHLCGLIYVCRAAHGIPSLSFLMSAGSAVVIIACLLSSVTLAKDLQEFLNSF